MNNKTIKIISPEKFYNLNWKDINETNELSSYRKYIISLIGNDININLKDKILKAESNKAIFKALDDININYILI
tara:strand:+ start:1366 stop:1590 length:225 start_codon:yes stop_codon:yes gene_type:complete